ncbi:ANK-REP-REGION domain-containing protein [Mycena venus]|uniref:ANK-REP-REGION domain-containing protein n=1 Tax=Mycena venus TaxID=2733690 RepID=A0A8H6WUV0_9AGAR|nr:ANK-REP-REGION domain-containing protein [Mycena venus]
MSFGVGVGDIALVTTLTWKLYKSCKDSSEDFRRMASELAGLHAILGETKEFLEEHGQEVEDSRKNRLTILMGNCHESLEDLHALYRRYDSLNTNAQRTWDRMRFGLSDLSDIRHRLISSTTMLTSFIAMLNNASTSRVEKRLNKFVAEVQAGMREGSVMSVSNVATTIESPEVWAQLIRELEDVGISAVVVEQRHDFIVSWFRDALTNGLLDENARVVGLDVASMSGRETPNDDEGPCSRTLSPTNDDDDDDDEGPDSRSLTPTNDVEGDPSWYYPALSHSSHDSSEPPRKTVGHLREAIDLSIATSEFNAEVQRTRNERNVAELLDPLAAMSTYSLSLPSPDSASSSQTTLPTPRRRSTFGLVQKLFQKPTAIIQAASDGDIDRVAPDDPIGVDVNAVDRWGWSALSMCGYGGHVAIARLLLDNGAKIENVDVDGDTPKSLAANRGHTDVVIMLEQEEELRKLNAKDPNQAPRRTKSRTSS